MDDDSNMSMPANGNGNRRPKTLDYRKTVDDPSRFTSTLTPAEIETIRAKARETVALEAKKREEDALLQTFLAEEREALLPDEQKFPMMMNLAQHQAYIMLDGTQYLHGHLYYVTAATAQVLAEQTARGWAHEEQTEVRESSGRSRRQRTPDYIGTANYVDRRVPREIVASSAVLESAGPAAFGIPRTD
jgi:hypothetical protein